MNKFSKSQPPPTLDVAPNRRGQLGLYFHEQRISAGLSLVQVAHDLELPSPDILEGYESGRLAMPLEDIFALTNLLNVSPEHVMELVHAYHVHGDR